MKSQLHYYYATH